MSVFTYVNNSWRNLAFAKVYKDGTWHSINSTDKIRKNQSWHTILDDDYTVIFKRSNASAVVDAYFTGVSSNYPYITDVNGKLLRTDSNAGSYSSHIRLDTTSQSLRVYMKGIGTLTREFSINGGLAALDLSTFSALQNLVVSLSGQSSLTTLDLSSNTKLLYANLTNLSSEPIFIDLSNNTLLQTLYMSGVKGSVENNTNLSSLTIKDAGLVTIDLSNINNLSYLNLMGNRLSSITLPTAPTKRPNINLADNKLSSTEVNSILSWLVATCESVEAASGATFTANLAQSIDSPPTGQGLIDKQRLIYEFGYTVITNEAVAANSITISEPQNLGSGNPVTVDVVLTYKGVTYQETLTRTAGEGSEDAQQVYTGTDIVINGTGAVYNWNLYLNNTLIATAQSNAKYPNTISNWIFK